MGNRWQGIWSARRVERSGAAGLEALMEADGFRTGFGVVEPSAWTGFIESLMARLDIRPGEAVFELGCGAGALLYPLWQRGVKVGGLDYAPGLLEAARAAMPDGEFHHAEAAQPPCDLQADHILSFGVFMYFPDQGYAGRVLDWAYTAARRSVALLDLPDLATRESAESARRAYLGEEEYRRLYTGLEHQYYDREAFQQRMRRPGWQVETRDQWLDGYFHAPYRFNAWALRDGRA
jgi:SAM-dependent methyltransferase